MPCYMTGSAEGDAQMLAADARREAQHTTRLLCEAWGLLRGQRVSAELQKWGEAHDKIDKRRQRTEAKAARMTATRDAAIAKLTDEERYALGVK